MRWLAVLTAAATIASACGGGGGDEESAVASTTVAVGSGADADVDDPGDAGESSSPADDAAEPQAEQDETVDEPVRLQPEVWVEADLGLGSLGSVSSGLTVLGDTVWAHAGAWDGAFTARSTDRGETFQVVEIVPPDNGGFQRATIEGFAAIGDRVVAWGHGSTGCVVTDVEAGRRVAEFCRNLRAVIHLSTDGGSSWRQIASPSMARNGDQNTRIRKIVAHDGGFVAVGEVQGQDWFGRIWESADGENWTVARDIRSSGGATAAVDAVSNGTDLLVHWYQATCIFDPRSPSDSSAPSWTLATVWPTDVNLWLGADVDSLAPVDPSVSPLLPAPRDVDCAAADLFQLAVDDYPSVAIEVLDGNLVFFERSVAVYDEVVVDDDRNRFGPLRFSQLVDGGWTTTEFPDVPTSGDGFSSNRFVVSSNDGALEFVDRIAHHGFSGTREIQYVTVQPDGSAAWVELPPVRGDDLAGVVRVDDRTIALIEVEPQGLEGARFTSSLVELRIAVHDPGANRATCAPVAGGSCRYAELELIEGFPSLAGLDLAGIDLSHTDLGDGDFSDAVLDGATLVGIDSRDASFVGASLRGVDGRQGEFNDATGADFTGADLFGATVVLKGPAVLDGARLAGASIGPGFEGEEDDPAVELSLAGLDLRSVTIDGPFRGPLLVITDLSGAVIDERTLFDDVDLSGAMLGDVDITIARVGEATICPTGFENTGEFRGNCVPTE